MVENHLKLYLVFTAIVCACSSTLSTEQRYVRGQNSNQRSQTSNSNDFTIQPNQKVSNRLIGGHIRVETSTQSNRKRDDDEAHWGDGLILSSAGNGKEKKLNRQEDDDDKKTLAQQVKEGKYGLIQNEIYGNKPKRPGIISYLSNPEVPKDNVKNLGGLDEEEIWLAENHVLVLRGGNFPEHETEQPTGDLQGWSPIDSYQAPKRQVQIPSEPKVPPPFPIQLTDDGPVKVLSSNETNDTGNKSNWFDTLGISSNETFSKQEIGNNTGDISGRRKTESGQDLGGVVGPFFPSIPPGAVFVPPPNNQSDYDEDDQSIYYPPPYSFKYIQDNSTAVPPGPLVPGIILPPPPDFFSQLEEKKTTKIYSTKYPKRPTTPKSDEAYYPSRKSNSKHKVAYSSTASSTKEMPRPFTVKPVNKSKLKNVTTSFSGTITRPTERVTMMKMTTPMPRKNSTIDKPEIDTIKPVLGNQVIESTTEEPKSQWTGSLNSKSGPIVAYYETSTLAMPVDEPIEATPLSIKNSVTTGKRPGNIPTSASYYFYEEANDEASGTTANTVYFEETTQVPYFRVDKLSLPQQSPTKKPFFKLEVTPSQQTAEDYSVEVIEPIVKSSPKYQYPQRSSPDKSQVTSRAQGQRMLSETSPLYYQTVTEKPQLSLQSFYTTPVTSRNKIKYDGGAKSKPVYQYSFEVAGYSKHNREHLYKPEIQEQPQKQVTFNEWQEVQEEGHHYADYDTEVIPEQRLQSAKSLYRSRQPVVPFPTTTLRSIDHFVETTPNPQHAYYTKQDEGLLDDVTKEYFTNFGRKINHQKIPSTTPIYGKTSSITERPLRPNYSTVNSFVDDEFEGRPVYKTPRVKVHYGDQPERPYSLEDDTRVNYKRPLPSINPDAEFLPGYNPMQGDSVIQRLRGQQKPYRNSYVQNPNLSSQKLVEIDSYSRQQSSGPTNFVPLDETREVEGQRIFPSRPISLAGDISVNYRHPQPPINPDAEFIDPATGQPGNSNRPSSYFAYRLPGDGGHFYFLTPHAITQRQDGSSGYLYSRPRGPRLARSRRPETQ